MRRSNGFSLIEMAIVLAIIALLAAAILVLGSSVFGQAGTASLLSNIQDLAVASREFKTRYSYFPGDLPNADKYIVGLSDNCKPPTLAGGNIGNGLVDSPSESDCALEHLVKAGMLAKIAHEGARYIISLPNIGLVSLWFDSDDTTKVNAVRIWNPPISPSNPPILPCEVALEIDRKLDSATAGNATPFSEGSVRARDAADATIETCVPASPGNPGVNDPVPRLLIRY